MTQLIAARAIQGLGAGAIIPISQAVVGEMYTLAERPRMQALFSGMWGLASIAGPLVGGYITDAWSWRWVFYINVPAGLLAFGVIAVAYPATRGAGRITVDWLGALLLFAAVSLLLIGLGGDAGHRSAWILGSLVTLIALVWHILLAVTIVWFFGWLALLLSLIIPHFIASGIGSYLFYAQHNFPGVSFSDMPGFSPDHSTVPGKLIASAMLCS